MWVGQIVATDADGSSFAFVTPAKWGPPRAELDLWSAGPGGGSVTPITQLPGPPERVGETEIGDAAVDADVERWLGARVPRPASSMPGGFNSGGFKQIYRYDAPANTLGCVSCPPHGVIPTGDAAMSPAASRVKLKNAVENADRHSRVGRSSVVSPPMAVRVFFDTPDPLVPQDTNTGSPDSNIPRMASRMCRGRDVYEWENGVVYLISSGKSPRDSYFLDNSENGDDVFFATTEGLVPGDTDGGV